MTLGWRLRCCLDCGAGIKKFMFRVQDIGDSGVWASGLGSVRALCVSEYM